MKKFSLIMALAALSSISLLAESPEKYWNFEELSSPPKYSPATQENSIVPGLKAIFYDGLKVDGKDSPVFAYIGIPDGVMPEGGYPGIVLVHGGGGTAYPGYVKLWMSYGYAVIAMDWYNQRPDISKATNPRMREADLPVRIPLEGGRRRNIAANVGNMVLAHSLLRSLPEVNPAKTGFVGLSWGSWYGTAVAAVDSRFQFALEIYCGDYKPKKSFVVDGHFLPFAKIPMYWIAGTNDQNVTPETLQAAFKACPKVWNKSLDIALPHSHIGFEFPVCRRVADHFLKDGPALPKLAYPKISGKTISAEILDTGKGIKKATFSYTTHREQTVSHKRKWMNVEAFVSGNTVSATLPDKVFQCFLSVYDDLERKHYCCGSTDILIFPADGKQ